MVAAEAEWTYPYHNSEVGTQEDEDLVESALPGPCILEYLPFIVVRISPQRLRRHRQPLRQ